MSSTPASAAGWFPTIPTECPPRRAKPQTMFAAQCGCTSRKSPSSTTFAITRFMSYGFVASSGTNESSSGVLAVDRIGGSGVRGALDVVLRQEREQVARVLEAGLLVRRGEVRDARLRGVRRRAAELLERDLLAGHGLHDVGAGDEHVRRALGHQHEVGDRRRVDGAAGARPHHERELRHDPGGLDVAPEDLGVAGERDDALLDPRPARVVDPDHRAAVLHAPCPSPCRSSRRRPPTASRRRP